MDSCGIWHRLSRKKHLNHDDVQQTKLKRCLGVFDLTALGVGATMGVGIYVLAGQVAKNVAGPSVMLSFLIAGIASFLSAMCYAEMAARVPKAGSAYVYTYVTMGEGFAWVIGWNLVLEYAIGTASVARAYSGYLDSLINGTMSKIFRDVFPVDIPYLSPYPDLCACVITLLMTVLISVGVKESLILNNILTFLNVCVVIFVTTAGISQSDSHNWSLQEEDIPGEDFGRGGFFPYGIIGTVAGAATCFYGFVGFDSVATSAEEAVNPQKTLPIAILCSLGIVGVSYVSVSSVLTLMMPYYLQDPLAPLPAAFVYCNMNWASVAVTLGALFGLSTALLGSVYPLPRILYAMSSDGIIFRCMSHVHSRFQTPTMASLISGCLISLIATFFELTALVQMMSIGTLMAYTIVGVCVIVLRYRDDSSLGDFINMSLVSPSNSSTRSDEVSGDDEMTSSDCYEDDLDQIGRTRKYNLQENSHSAKYHCLSWKDLFSGSVSPVRQRVTHIFTASVIILSVTLAFILAFTSGTLCLILFCCVSIALVILTICLWLQPIAISMTKKTNFLVPAVPFLPAFSIFINMYLMLLLPTETWVRFLVWMTLGTLIYACYGWRNSSEEYRDFGLVPPNEVNHSENQHLIEKTSFKS